MSCWLCCIHCERSFMSGIKPWDEALQSMFWVLVLTLLALYVSWQSLEISWCCLLGGSCGRFCDGLSTYSNYYLMVLKRPVKRHPILLPVTRSVFGQGMCFGDDQPHRPWGFDLPSRKGIPCDLVALKGHKITTQLDTS